MAGRELLRPTHVALIKKIVVLVIVAVLAYAGYKYALGRRPPLPDIGAYMVANQYLWALQSGNYQTAYYIVCTEAEGETSPEAMGQVCVEVYRSIDGWEFGEVKYAPTHLSASVPTTLHYHATWMPEDALKVVGEMGFKLEDGEWRLIAALPFVRAIRKGREAQRLGE